MSSGAVFSLGASGLEERNLCYLPYCAEQIDQTPFFCNCSKTFFWTGVLYMNNTSCF